MDAEKFKEFLSHSLNVTEHALNMYASSFAILPAKNIYDKHLLEPYKGVIESCHIYIIGLLPKIEFIDATQQVTSLSLNFSILNDIFCITKNIPDDLKLVNDDGLFFLQDQEGKGYWYNNLDIMQSFSEKTDKFNFEVKYIGQAYGKDGSRNAIDRLLKHETLQKISLMGIPEGFELTLLLLEVQSDNRVFTSFNPFAKSNDADNSRIKAGLDKLFNTTEQERITLYEASLIRYFYPEFNKEFKDSFPSTNLKILQDCYDKDFSAVISEICIDDLPFRIFSKSQNALEYHIAKFDLHDDKKRKAFFFDKI